MKLIMTTAAAALISTAAVADNSTRHNDIFLDTSVSADAGDVYGNNDRMRNPNASITRSTSSGMAPSSTRKSHWRK